MVDTIINSENRKIFPWKLAVIMIFFSAAIFLIGYSYYNLQKKNLFKEEENSLSSIALLKIGQIERWRSERITDATVFSKDKSLIKNFIHFLSDSNDEAKEELTEWIKLIGKQYDYLNVLIADTSFKVRLSVNSSDFFLGDSIKEEMKKAMKSNIVVLTDLHRSKEIPSIHLDILIPLVDSSNLKKTDIGFAIFRIDPYKILFPLVQSWPVSSKSSETLLLRREKDSVLYLNELRHYKNTALRLKLPLINKTLLATKAVNGTEGLAEGTDYRNISVVGAVHKVPGMAWYMVAKVDKEEILYPLKKYVILLIIIMVLIVLINASIFVFWIWQQRIKFYRSELINKIALIESEKRLREAQEMAHLGFWLWDIKTGDVAWSEEVYKIFCLNPHTFTPKIDSILELSPWPEDHERDKELIRRAVENHIPGNYEQKFLRPDKSIGYYISTFRGNYDNGGELVSIVGTVLDITERKNAELKLGESEERFRSLYENVSIGIYRTTSDGQILMANPALIKMLGFDSFEQLSIRNLDHEGYEPDYPRSKFLETIEKEGKIIGLESAWNKQDGSTLFIRENAIAVKDGTGRMLYYDGTVEDITDRKKIEEALVESEDKFKYIFDHSVIGKSITMPTGEINVNQSFCDMLGYSREDLQKIKWQDITHPDDIELTQNVLKSILSGKSASARFIKRYIKKDGNVIWTDVGSALRRDINGNPLYFLTVINDITDRKKAEEMILQLNAELEQKVIQRTELLEAANKELEAFSYSVSHDLRAPLRSIHGFTNILLEDYESKLDEEGKRICGIISSSTMQMGELIDDLLNFSRIGRSSMNPGLIDMTRLANTVFVEIADEKEKEKTTFKIVKLHKVYGDLNLLKQVWKNLIYNAIKYTSTNSTPEIEIGSRRKNGMVIFYVKDNGVGFDMKYKHKLFGVFQRLHSEQEFEGNGVGLAIVQRIIHRHNGKVWAEGEVGKGATFYFSLPGGKIIL